MVGLWYYYSEIAHLCFWPENAPGGGFLANPLKGEIRGFSRYGMDGLAYFERYLKNAKQLGVSAL